MKLRELKLSDICTKITSGGTPLRKIEAYYLNGTIPWIKTKQVNYNRIHESEELITELALENSSAKLIPENSVIVAMYGDGNTAGRCAINKIPVATNQACCNLIIDSNKADYNFVYYFLSTQYKKLVSLKLGGGQQNLNSTTLKDFKIFLPSLTIQNKISFILSAYDDLIENNLKRIKLLEELAHRTYDEWFVEFKLKGTQFENTDRGLPKGWKLGKVGDLIQLQRGFDLPSQKRELGNIPIIASTGIVGFHNESKVKAPGIVTGRSGTIGIVNFIDKDFWPLNTSLWIKEYCGCGPHFAYFFLKNLKLKQFKSGVAVPSLDRNVVHSQSCVIPSSEYLQVFEDYARPIFEYRSNLQNQNSLLKESRDFLLPKLMNGVIDTEKVQEESLAMAAEPELHYNLKK